MTLEEWKVVDAENLDFEKVHELKVSLLAGKVDIVGHDEPNTRLEIRAVTGRPLTVRFENGVLEVDHPQLSLSNVFERLGNLQLKARAEVSVLVPREVLTKSRAASAASLISGLRADVSAASVSGTVMIDDHRGAIDANTVSGDLTVRGQTGSVVARTVSGDITVDGTLSRATCDTVSGTIMLDIDGEPASVGINSVSGDVTTRLAPGIAAQYRVVTVSGRVQLDNTRIRVRGTYSATHGEVTDRSLDFSAKTVSGDITVLRRAATSSPTEASATETSTATDAL